MSSSPAFQKFATLYYERQLPVIDRSIRHNRATIVFEDTDENVFLESEAEDFVETAKNLVPSYRENGDTYIDVRDTEAESPEEYLKRLEYFVSQEDNPILNMTRRINNGEVSAPESLDLTEALDALINENWENDELGILLQNHVEAMALKQSDTNKMNAPFKKYKQNAAYDTERFSSLYENLTDSLNSRYQSGSPAECYVSWRNNCETDLEYISSRLLSTLERKELEWGTLLDADSQQVGEFAIQFWQRDSDSPSLGTIDGEHGIERICEQYALLFELTRDPLHDIATAVCPSGTDLSDTGKVLNCLEDSEVSQITELIEPQMRHGPSHQSLEIDTDDRVLKIYEERGGDRTLADQFHLDEVPFKYYQLSDLLAASIFALTRMNDLVVLNFLTSNELLSRLIEDLPAEQFPEASTK